MGAEMGDSWPQVGWGGGQSVAGNVSSSLLRRVVGSLFGNASLASVSEAAGGVETEWVVDGQVLLGACARAACRVCA